MFPLCPFSLDLSSQRRRQSPSRPVRNDQLSLRSRGRQRNYYKPYTSSRLPRFNGARINAKTSIFKITISIFPVLSHVLTHVRIAYMLFQDQVYHFPDLDYGNRVVLDAFPSRKKSFSPPSAVTEGRHEQDATFEQFNVRPTRYEDERKKFSPLCIAI